MRVASDLRTSLVNGDARTIVVDQANAYRSLFCGFHRKMNWKRVLVPNLSEPCRSQAISLYRPFAKVQSVVFPNYPGAIDS